MPQSPDDKGIDALQMARAIVRRQGFGNQELLKQVKSLARLVDVIMRRAVCDASAALRASFV